MVTFTIVDGAGLVCHEGVLGVVVGGSEDVQLSSPKKSQHKRANAERDQIDCERLQINDGNGKERDMSGVFNGYMAHTRNGNGVAETKHDVHKSLEINEVPKEQKDNDVLNIRRNNTSHGNLLNSQTFGQSLPESFPKRIVNVDRPTQGHQTLRLIRYTLDVNKWTPVDESVEIDIDSPRISTMEQLKSVSQLPVRFVVIWGPPGKCEELIQRTIQAFFPCDIYAPVGFSCSTDTDILIDPLQPLRDDLDLSIYGVFERDRRKYIQYREAMELALGDIREQSITPSVLFVGAGTGKLIDMLFSIDTDLLVVAVEKNKQCAKVLHEKNAAHWGGKVRILVQDVRGLDLGHFSLVVSELLGSFGDNELSPEILYPFDNTSSLVVPSSYTAYVRPIYAPAIPAITRPFLARLSGCLSMADFQPVWTFDHTRPASSELLVQKDLADDTANLTNSFEPTNFHHTSNPFERTSTLVFTNDGPDITINGFQGIFSSCLYGHIRICSWRDECADDEYCDSWYPMVFPVNPIHVPSGKSILFGIKRISTRDRVWYEWSVEGAHYNENGGEYYMDNTPNK